MYARCTYDWSGTANYCFGSGGGMGFLWGLDLADQQAGVVAAEAEGVGHGVLEARAGAAGDVGDVVEVAFGVGFVVVDGGGQVAAGEGEGGDDQFDAAGGAQGVADGGFGGGDGEFFGGGSEDLFDGFGFGEIAQFGGGAVGVDVADLFGVDFGFADGVGHGGGGAGAVFIGGGDVAGVAGGADANEFGGD